MEAEGTKVLKKTFANLFASSSHDAPIESSSVVGDLKKGLHRGKPAVFFTSQKLKSYAIPFKWALIGKFSQGRPRMEDIHKYFVSLDLKGTFKLGLLDNRHIVINFSLEDDFHRIFSRLTWNVYKWPMRVFKYSINFHVNKESSIVPVWVNFEKLPLVLFNKEALFSIASLIGQPLRLDMATADLRRPSVARVQVEIDLLKQVPDTVWIGMGDDDGFWQEVKYENLPSYCAYCWHLGHSEVYCLVKHPELKEMNKSKAPTDKSNETGKVYRPKPNQSVLVDNEQMKGAQVDKGQISVQSLESENKINDDEDIAEKNEEGWITVQARKAKKQESTQLRDHLHVASKKEENDLLVVQEKGFSPSSVVVDMPEPSNIMEIPVKGAMIGQDSTIVEGTLKQKNQDMSKAMVLYEKKNVDVGNTGEKSKVQFLNINKLSSRQLEEIVEESIKDAAKELIESVADQVVREDISTSPEKSPVESLSTCPPCVREEQPLQSILPSRYQVTDLTQEEIQNLVQEGIIVEGSMNEPVLEFDNDEDDEADFEEELNELVEHGNLSPRISGNKLFRRKGSRSRRKNFRYRDFYC